MKRQSPVWRVLGQEVEPDAGENLLVVLVFPQQLHFADGYHVRLGPDFDEEKLSQGQDLRALVTAPLIPDSLVECVVLLRVPLCKHPFSPSFEILFYKGRDDIFVG